MTGVTSYPIFIITLGYVLGSIPFGLLLTRLSGAGDLRSVGSGNIGATNVLRTGRKGLAAATLLLDMGKGALAVWLGARLGGDLLNGGILAGVASLVGHCYPIWLGFKGGKGVATLLGIGLALNLLVGLTCAFVWLLGTMLSRISSVGGMASAIAAPIAALTLAHGSNALPLSCLALITLWKHHANITRLRTGTEPKIGSSVK